MPVSYSISDKISLYPQDETTPLVEINSTRVQTWGHSQLDGARRTYHSCEVGCRPHHFAVFSLVCFCHIKKLSSLRDSSIGEVGHFPTVLCDEDWRKTSSGQMCGCTAWTLRILWLLDLNNVRVWSTRSIQEGIFVWEIQQQSCQCKKKHYRWHMTKFHTCKTNINKHKKHPQLKDFPRNKCTINMPRPVVFSCLLPQEKLLFQVYTYSYPWSLTQCDLDITVFQAMCIELLSTLWADRQSSVYSVISVLAASGATKIKKTKKTDPCITRILQVTVGSTDHCRPQPYRQPHFWCGF